MICIKKTFIKGEMCPNHWYFLLIQKPVKEEKPNQVNPILVGFFIFVVIGSAIFTIFENWK
jgi:Ni,Fe-hydrogenase I cytochrome b subunit